MLTTATNRTYGFTRTDRYSVKREGLTELTNDEIRAKAPSVFADQAWNTMSARYKFIPTIEVVEWLRGEGFLPVRALQGRTRIEGKGDYTKHMVRFRRRSDLDMAVDHVGQEYPEITLVNSHDGTSSYQLYPSIFRAVCLNGLIVHSKDLEGISVRHKGGNDFHHEIIDASYRILEQSTDSLDKIEEYCQIELTPPQRNAFAVAALELQSNESLQPRQILQERRPGDSDPTLWNTLNVVQENMVKGGIRTRNQETYRRSTTKGINSVTGDVTTNRALWRLAEEMSRLVS